ncbi:histidine phosphatase family protein [Hymenobacter amundsenii]|uniref:Histidine phosphatase family protein n=1 Tax=Hymenobacter amundsenii TaxID=2006685 RepID=A0A246FLM3_9BACT|nr:histidine phosphatase family protein [Hymenobacter amundsenii]OWP63641.1 histidine phosphatase family protein [Hymenobacter amundsenii]
MAATPEADPTEVVKATAQLLLLPQHLPAPDAAPAPEPPLRVVIIRHGEKPEQGDNLSVAGLNRALALPTVLARVFSIPPSHTFVPEIGIGGKRTTRMRMLQTVMPYAVQHNLTIDTNYEVESSRQFAKRLRRLRGNVLVVWEHHNIVEIARDLGLKDAQEWDSDDFDSIWTITFERLGRVKDDRPAKAKKPRLTISRQGLNPSGEFLDHRAGE